MKLFLDLYLDKFLDIKTVFLSYCKGMNIFVGYEKNKSSMKLFQVDY